MKNTYLAKSFHAYADSELVSGVASFFGTKKKRHFIIQERELDYRFYSHFHPYVGKLVERLLQKSTSGLQAADTEYVKKADGSFETLPDGKSKPVLYADFFAARYQPSPDLVQKPYPVKDLDFTSSGAYSVYNWELFFHVPLTIAIHLSKNQRFAEAQRWFHYLFDPTDDSDGPTPERFWKVRPFQYTDVRKVEEILINLSINADPELRDETVRSIEAWKDTPFRPHVVARYRQQAYMYKTVMAYLDNLIAWGDSLFRQDTGESVDEALMIYVLAANILGPRPQAVPKKGAVRPQTYANLRKDLDRFGNAMRDIEADVPFDLMPFPAEGGPGDERLVTLRSLGKALYFCVPRNDKLLSYWDTVADRLFKIHNSLNLQGIFRQLALFEPPIDPAMLARAAAAGLDVGAIVNGLNQPLPLVRFQVLVQKAAEICQEVKSLGNNLLSAMEKEDGEALALLRARHERAVLEMAEHVRYAQWQEAIKSREGLLASLALAVQRYTFYERQLGRKADEIQQAIPELDELDKDGLEKMKLAMKEPALALREIGVDIATDAFSDAAQTLNGGKILSSHEVREAFLLEAGQLSSDIANILGVASSVAHLFPTAKVHAQPLGVGGTVEYGGRNVGDGLAAGSGAARAIAERLNFEARRAARIDGFARREREWAFQSNLAAGEITQIFKQLRAAQIREALAERELKNHRQQMKQAEEIERFLNEEGTEKKGKKTHKALYTWMKREVKALYGQFFQFAFDVAKKAERALQHELGNPELTYLQFGYLAGKEGLLAGEKLYLDIKRMEMAYLDLNQREYELTKHVSLLQVDPLALLTLRATGRCTVRLPEALFDMDGPGHYFRRIKSVAVSIPCVTGPYASVNCTLTLQKSSIRKTQILRDGVYAREGAEDDRFSDSFGSLQSIVTSSAQNDSGLFETNLRDERYLPFEGAGVVSEWQLELPANPSQNDPRPFDYDTISDVILHLRYTAREGGGLLRKEAAGELKALVDAGQAVGSVRLFSVRHEFPGEWARFRNQTPGADQRFELALTLRDEHYPFWSQGRLKGVPRVDLLARGAGATLEVFDKAGKNDATARKDTLTKDATKGNLLMGSLTGGATGIALPAAPVGEIKLFFDQKDVVDLWMAVTWGSE
ncbi:MAG TPA: insecticidal toxin protein [Thermoanaerobaculia bacterium]|nr:insecticidal toxin protein [Thermoanaerobaculia bacterium]